MNYALCLRVSEYFGGKNIEGLSNGSSCDGLKFRLKKKIGTINLVDYFYLIILVILKKILPELTIITFLST